MFISLDDDVNMTLKPGISAITYNTEVTRLGALEPLRRTLRALRQHVCLRGSDLAGVIPPNDCRRSRCHKHTVSFACSWMVRVTSKKQIDGCLHAE